ncbi:MAG: hypothetical protein E5299_00072 [Burkholderia gladioli]|nr:MAG: hypothetical protein E5299_00072 [Burkholderia gladioli]
MINRRNVTIWIDEAVLARIHDAISTRGHPCLYGGDALIHALLGVKTVYRLTLRGLQSFTQSLRDLAFPSLPVRNYTTLCRRAKTLHVELPILRDNKPIHLVVDNFGLKVYGEGEWKVRQHGYSKRRTWRKVHLALNANTGQVHAALMTNQNVADGDALAKLLDQIPREEQIDVIGGDGAYDTKPCHAAIAARRALLHKSNVRTPWHWTGIIQAIRTDCGRARSAIRSYRLNYARPMPWRPHVRFMQQRHLKSRVDDQYCVFTFNLCNNTTFSGTNRYA